MYDFKKIEKKWQQYWSEFKTFKTDVWDFSKPKYYVLDMFPYPSGDGLHAGHIEGYTATDIVARFKKMQGFNVLHPMGWDAFGLPAEQYAINTGNHPDGFTEQNIQVFKKQLNMLGFSYDWDKEISTSDPAYYKWTQWIFINLFKDGLVKYIDMPVNWCEELGTVLANDEVIDGKSERGGFPVVRKNLKQWVIDIPKYADILLENLDELDWPESTKEMQKNWIGKSYGAELSFKVADTEHSFQVFTTRPDTLFGATYCVLAPEHELVSKITSEDKLVEVKNYLNKIACKSDLERTELNKEKTGVFIGSYAINPVNNEKIPIYIADYVLATYGTGAIMAVPAHDERDYEFAKKFDLPIIPVIQKITGQKRENEIFKKSIVAVVYNPKNNKYLTINWGEKGGRLFVGGTIEENEDVLNCAKREITEETGYSDLKYIGSSFSINHHYYAYNKNKAFEIEATGVYFELLSEKIDNRNLDDDEVNNFKVEWVDSKVIELEVKDELHKTVYDNCINHSVYTGDGKMINSGFLNGIDNKQEAIATIIDWLEKNNIGRAKTTYRLREWIFSRQRYWGEPMPIIHYDDRYETISHSDLPLVLPKLKNYAPDRFGNAPLEKAVDWVNVLVNDKKGRRETSTMPGSAGSSWYFLRYIDPHNDKEIADAELLKHWLPVDLYVGGPEHAVGHLLYSRMWNNFLYKKGIVPVKEPFQKLIHQGMILGANGEKMSKSRGNVVNPDHIVDLYGADTLRVYEMFMGPLEASKPWSETGIEGSKRFLERVYRLYFEDNKIKDVKNQDLERVYHYTVKKVTEDYENLAFNTAISQMMIFINEVYKTDTFPREYAEGFTKLLNPIAPHLTEEIWMECLGHNNTVAYSNWPNYDEDKIISEEYTMVVQVNGKVRGKIVVGINTSEDEMKQLAKQIDNVKNHLEGKEIVKIVTVPKKLVNIVVKD